MMRNKLSATTCCWRIVPKTVCCIFLISSFSLKEFFFFFFCFLQSVYSFDLIGKLFSLFSLNIGDIFSFWFVRWSFWSKSPKCKVLKKIDPNHLGLTFSSSNTPFSFDVTPRKKLSIEDVSVANVTIEDMTKWFDNFPEDPDYVKEWKASWIHQETPTWCQSAPVLTSLNLPDWYCPKIKLSSDHEPRELIKSKNDEDEGIRTPN